jgi:hypothetical protein
MHQVLAALALTCGKSTDACIHSTHLGLARGSASARRTAGAWLRGWQLSSALRAAAWRLHHNDNHPIKAPQCKHNLFGVSRHMTHKHDQDQEDLPARLCVWQQSSRGAPEERLREFHQSAHSTASVISSFRSAAGLLSALNAGRNPSSVNCTSSHSPLVSGSRTPCSTKIGCPCGVLNSSMPHEAEHALLCIQPCKVCAREYERACGLHCRADMPVSQGAHVSDSRGARLQGLELDTVDTGSPGVKVGLVQPTRQPACMATKRRKQGRPRMTLNIS